MIKWRCLVSNLEDVKHITVYLTSYPWKQSRILCYACNLKGATANSFMTGSAGVRTQSLIAFLQSVDALVHFTPHPDYTEVELMTLPLND